MARQKHNYEPRDNDFGGRLKMLMEEKGDNRSSLAKLTGVSRQSVDYWLKGQNKLEVKNLIVLSEHYDVPIDWLLGMPGSTRFNDIDTKELAKLTLLSDKSLEFLINLKSEYDNETIREAIDFLLCSEYSEKFLKAVSYSIHYLLDSERIMISDKNSQLFRNTEDHAFQFPGTSELQEKANKNGFVIFAHSFKDEAERQIGLAQNTLYKMFDSLVDEKLNNIKQRSKKRSKKKEGEDNSETLDINPEENKQTDSKED